jgi:hypothetical protein
MGVGQADASCTTCGPAAPSAIPDDVGRAIESRLAELASRGGDCARYGAVLETSYRNGQITIRPYMWRVGRELASGEAKPNGAMTLAREIDSLNVGVRRIDELLWTLEHEAAHIAFGLESGHDASEARANQYVRGCRAADRE